MKNPATIPAAARDSGEYLMARVACLQDKARQITRMMGRAETIYRRSADTFRHGIERAACAAEVRRCRRWLRSRGYDAAAVCAQFRDPDRFAFCDAGGATAADLR